MERMLRSVLLLALAVTLFSLTMSAGARGASAGGAATINIQSTAILGQQGKILLMFAEPEGGGQPLGRICATINSNIFALPVAAITEMSGGNPCDPPTSDVVFAPGMYRLTVGVYQGGSQTPELTVSIDVEVPGASYYSLDGAALSARPVGDANCDGLVGLPDVTGALAGIAGAGDPPGCLDLANVICDNPLDAFDPLATLRSVGGVPMSLPGGCPALLQTPDLVSPADGAILDYVPRDVTTVWNAVPGAAGYFLHVDERDSCFPYTSWCSDLGNGVELSPVSGTTSEFSFGTRGHGRWRVAAIDAQGRPGPWSDWREFEFLQ